MAYIYLPDIDKVDEATKRQFDMTKSLTGEIGETVRILATRPDILSMTNKMVNTLLVPQTELDYETKELIAIAVSLENGCTMCAGEHERIASMLGIDAEKVEKIKQGIDAMDLPRHKKDLLKFCIKSAKNSYKVMKKDLDQLRDEGYTDSQLVEAVAIVGYFNYINTVVNALGAGKDI